MKYYLLLSGCLLALGAKAQNHFPSSGNIGIGTDQPAGELQIKGPSVFDASTRLYLTNNASMYGRTNLVLTGRFQNGNDGWNFGSGARNSIVFAQNTGENGYTGTEQYSIQLEGNSNSLGFLSLAKGGAPNMTLTQSGKIGIGTTGPRALLDIGADISDGQLGAVFGRLPEGDVHGDGTFLGVRGYNTQGAWPIKSFALEHSFYGQVNSSVNFYRGSGQLGGFITLSTQNNAERMRITPEGKVGIGTETPEEFFELKSDAPVQSFHQPGVATYKAGVSNGIFKIAAMDNGYGGHAGNFTANKEQVISMIANGNVGIRTTIPDAKLAVRGKIHAQEVKVELNIPGPDYVFEKSYGLKPLSEVEAFIGQNKHLPEIPSAKTMKEDGIKVGEMQMKLLQKIEELTLYIIELEKRVQKVETKK